MHEEESQSISAGTANQLSVDEKMTRLHGLQFWSYSAVDSGTNENLELRPFPRTNCVTTRSSLEDEDYDYEYVPYGNHNPTECITNMVYIRT